jgi:hypothetical protein
MSETIKTKAALLDLIFALQLKLRDAENDEDIVLPKAVVAEIVELLRKVGIGGHGRRYREWRREWTMHTQYRERRREGKSPTDAAREMQEEYPDLLGEDRTEEEIKKIVTRLQRSRPHSKRPRSILL